ncbi:phosphoadenylyl-sulfate reductase [Curvibacter sp. RS43]|uniref:phosphoadenylyl-sulfate reductase n=1 Tax=Curvibacter microcysteis TaxID=3026419 RepID=UPI0023611502|nr:phosphoadenylyl-sulfate reductase [Curvibacter sp. RS43]MDD0809419.1 phosphoadenylyl-sulfate reductase [Curvibacter sp. RS43]
MSAISLYAHTASADLSAKVAASLALLQQAVAEFQPLTQASSLGVEDMVITELLHQAGVLQAPSLSVFVLDTGKLHAETLALIGQIEARYGKTLDIYRPDAAAAQAFVAANGEDAMYKSIELRKACCDIRKMVPLAQALEGKKAWITGLRREQSNARAEVPDVDRSGERAKVNPLANWTLGDVWRFIELHGVPYNPLHDQFFPSIGCAPCTRAVTLGEDFRSGRWWWEQESAKECGLHVDHGEEAAPASSIIPIRPVNA